MSVFHRVEVEEVEKMPARRYFMLATRLPAYSGAVTARLAAAAAATAKTEPAEPPTPDRATPDRTGVRAGPTPGSSWSFATVGGEA